MEMKVNNQDILGNAPEGATHVDFDGDYWIMHPDDSPQMFIEDSWLHCDTQEPMRSLSDVNRIAELEKERNTHSLEQQVKGIDDFLLIVINSLPDEIVGAFKSYTKDYINSLKGVDV